MGTHHVGSPAYVSKINDEWQTGDIIPVSESTQRDNVAMPMTSETRIDKHH
jgi:hypothetical protein